TNPNHSFRAAAVVALGEIKDPAAVDPLINALSQSNDHVREHIFHALGRTRDARVAAALTTILQEKSLSHRLQEKGLEALREIPGGESLAEALISNNEQLQAWSVRAATQLSDPQALELLAEALRHLESAVRDRAAQLRG